MGSVTKADMEAALKNLKDEHEAAMVLLKSQMHKEYQDALDEKLAKMEKEMQKRDQDLKDKEKAK